MCLNSNTINVLDVFPAILQNKQVAHGFALSMY